MDMRTWGELLPKALQDSFGPVVELCQATPDACRPSDNTVKHAMDARDQKTSKIGRAGAELSVPPDQLGHVEKFLDEVGYDYEIEDKNAIGQRFLSSAETLR